MKYHREAKVAASSSCLFQWIFIHYRVISVQVEAIGKGHKNTNCQQCTPQEHVHQAQLVSSFAYKH